MIILGITGKSCSGKNYISSLLEKKGATCYDLDKKSHGILNDCASDIALTFGASLVEEDKGGLFVNRKALGHVVFNNPTKLAQLEAIIYPVLRSKLEQAIGQCKKAGYPVFIINGAVLEKGDFWQYCDTILWVKAPYLLRLIRSLKRDKISLRAIFSRFRAQKELKPNFFYGKVDINIINNSWLKSTLDKKLNPLYLDIIGERNIERRE